MKRNESNIDRIVRAVLGVALIGGGIALGGTLAIVLYVLAAVMFVTALIGFCPLYHLFGIDTCKLSKSCQ